MTETAVHVIVSGHVQGVFFRANACDLAKQLGLVGWVKNLPSGQVELQAIGDTVKVNELLKWLEHGPKLARVDNLEINYFDDLDSDFTEFKIV